MSEDKVRNTTLVEERNIIRQHIENSSTDFVDVKTVLGAYRKGRDSELWRASRQAEILCEYILYLESWSDRILERHEKMRQRAYIPEQLTQAQFETRNIADIFTII